MTRVAARHAGLLITLAALLFVGRPAPLQASGEYRTADIDALRVTIDTEWPRLVAPGYVPLRVELTNSGEARTIEIVVTGSRFFGIGRGGRSGALYLQRRVTVARGDRMRFTMPVPVIAENENYQVLIQENERTIHRFGYTGFQTPARAEQAGVLIVGTASGPFATAAAPWRRPMTGRGTAMMIGPGGGSSSGSVPVLDLILEPDRLPTNWLGYTSLRAVMVGPDEWKALGEEQRTAILTWTAAGGNLLLVDTDIRPVMPSATAAIPDSPAVAARGYLFGRIHAVTTAALAARGLPAALTEVERLQDPHFALPVNHATGWNTIASRGFRLEIPGVEGVQARVYLLILAAFSLLVGPLNYWYLARRRQLVLFVLTAPVLSVLCIFLLAGYVLASEGTGVYGRAVTVTMLDQGRRQAATRASASLYSAGLTSPAALQFPTDAAVIHLGNDGNGRMDRLALDLTDGQRFSSNVIQARAPSNFEQVGIRTARERLPFTRTSGGIEVVNGLDAPVTMLLYRESGQVHSLSTVLAAGGRTTMRAGGLAPEAVIPGDISLASRLRHLVEHQPDGSYLAVLERSPFWNPGVGRVLEGRSFHLVIGWTAGQP
jgi:hypothetical protein